MSPYSCVEVSSSRRQPENTEEVGPQSLLRWCWGSRGLPQVSAPPATSSNTASLQTSASAGTASGSWWCSSDQPSGSVRRRKTPLRKPDVTKISRMKTHQNSTKEHSTRRKSNLVVPSLFWGPCNWWLHQLCTCWPTSMGLQARAPDILLPPGTHTTK